MSNTPAAGYNGEKPSKAKSERANCKAHFHKEYMKNPLRLLFSPKEATLIGWFIVIFLGSAGMLSLFGFLPNELTEQASGQTFSERLAAGIFGNDTAAEPDAGVPFSESALGILNNTNPSTRPSGSTGANGSNGSNNNTVGANGVVNGLPTRLIIPSISVDTKVYIPRNTSIAVMDSDLTKGPVYYPGSGTINTGNMFIFGHSTGHAVVINKAYKVFNELKNLSEGDMIYIESEGKKFSYRVRSVDKVDKNETMVTFDTKAHLLTLSTCNSFGSKSDRFVVVAEFVSQV